MRDIRTGGWPALAALLLAGCAHAPPEPGGPPGLPPKPVLSGINAPQAFPQGCVDCHVVVHQEDHRLKEWIGKTPKHPPMPVLEKIPDDCRICHDRGSQAGALDRLVHGIHYRNPESNRFIALFQGACLDCHRLDAASGGMGVKSGPRNW